MVLLLRGIRGRAAVVGAIVGVSACAARERAPAAAPSAEASSPAAVPPISTSSAERAQDVAWLRGFGLEVPDTGLVLVHPFAEPIGARSYIAPTAWYAELEREEVEPAALAEDLGVLARALPRVYGGYERATERGFDWDAWFTSWREDLRRADGPLPLVDAFRPMAKLMAVQLDNHTGPVIAERFGSGSRSARLQAPGRACDRLRVGQAEHPVAPGDPAAQPKTAMILESDAAATTPGHYLTYPASLGHATAVRCSGAWIELESLVAEDRKLAARAVGSLGKTRALELGDRPRYASLAAGVGYVRLPTFTKANTEAVLALADALPQSAGSEQVVVFDLRFNDGGDGRAIVEFLGRWVDASALWELKTRRTEKNSCLVEAMQWGYTQITMLGMEPPISEQLRARLQAQINGLLAPNGDDCAVTVAVDEPNWSYREHAFEPRSGRPRVVVLVNEWCGSDCEYITYLLASQPESIVVGTNTYGVLQFIQPSYFVLPRTRVGFRIARGTSDVYGDGRSIDGYGLGVDIVASGDQLLTAADLSTFATQVVMKH